MQFSIATVVLTLAGLVAASPIQLEARGANSTTVVSNLLTQVKGYTKVINATVATINSKSTAAQNKTAQATVTTQTNLIVAALNSAKSTVSTLKTRAVDASMSSRQQQIIDNSGELTAELTGTYNGVTKCWGQGYSGGLISQVFGALYGVLKALEFIVSDLVALVGGVVGDVLATVGGILGLLFQILFGWVPKSD